MDGNVEPRVADYLDSRGMRAEDLPKSQLKRLIQIDEAINRRIQASEEAEKIIRDSRITVSAIASDIGVARKTLYNNTVLLDYVSRHSAEARSRGADPEELKRAKEKNRELKDRLEKMLQRDAEAEDIKAEIANMAKAAQEKNNQIINLQESNDRLRRDLAEARAKIPATKGNVIEFSTKK